MATSSSLLFRHMKDLEYLSDYRNKRIGKDLDKQMMKHLELLCINAELVQITGSTSQKMQLIESLRKINNLYLVEELNLNLLTCSS
jgi:hypothetical protein